MPKRPITQLIGGPLGGLVIGEVEHNAKWVFVSWLRGHSNIRFATWPGDDEPPSMPEGWPHEHYRVLLYKLGTGENAGFWEFVREVTEGLDA